MPQKPTKTASKRPDIIVDENGNETYPDGMPVVYGRDGRIMSQNTLEAVAAARKPWQPGQSGNPNGRPKDPVVSFRTELRELLKNPDFTKKDDTEQKTLLTNILEKAVEKYYETKNEATFTKLLDTFISLADGDLKQDQIKNSLTTIQNVLILPPQNPPIQPQKAVDPPDDTTE